MPSWAVWDGTRTLGPLAPCCFRAGTGAAPGQLSSLWIFAVGCVTWVLAGRPESEELSWGSPFPGSLC